MLASVGPVDGRTDARNHYCDGIHTNNWPVNMSGRRLYHVYYSRVAHRDKLCLCPHTFLMVHDNNFGLLHKYVATKTNHCNPISFWEFTHTTIRRFMLSSSIYKIVNKCLVWVIEISKVYLHWRKKVMHERVTVSS